MMHQNKPNAQQQLAIKEAAMILETLYGYQEFINILKTSLHQGKDIIHASEVERYIFPSRLDVLARRSYIPFEIQSLYLQGHKAYEIDGLLRVLSQILPLLRGTFYSKGGSAAQECAQDLSIADPRNSHQAR